jgi:outer membrane receptor protein involved in Fe transport
MTSNVTLRWVRAAALAASIHLMMAPAVTYAQTLSQSLPAQSLVQALESFAQASGLQLVYKPELTASMVTRGAPAGLTYEVALHELLRGTGLTFEFVNDRTVALRPIRSKDATTPMRTAAVAGPLAMNGVEGFAKLDQESRPSSASRPDAPAPAPAVSGNQPEVTVTASRIERAGFSAPTPTVVLSASELAATAPANVADVVNYLPALSGSSTNRSSNAGGGAAAGMNLLNLRALGPNRTLVLLDGRRLVPSTIAGNVDANLFPQALIKRVEVVTGGASAAWGSDAVAGVVNFVLDTEFQGLIGTVQAGMTDQGQGTERAASLAAGTSFADGRAHMLFAVDWADVDAVSRAASRTWFRGSKVIANPAFAAGNGQPARIIRDGVGLSQSSNGGLITAGPLRGTAFAPDGAPVPFDFGTVSGLSSFGGSADDLGGEVQIQDAVQRASGYARISYEIAPTLEVFADVLAARSEANPTSVPYLRQANITVRNDNPYLHPSVVAQMAARGLTTFTMGRTNQDLGRVSYDNISRTIDARVGMTHRFGEDWKWNLSAAAGRNRFGIDAGNNVIVPRYNLAIDAVRNPATGQIICRSSLTVPGNGCVPLNLFGEGAPSADARNHVIGVASQRVELKQRVFSTDVQGTLATLPAGPVSLAAGAEYRYQSYDAVGDALSATNAFWLGNYKSSSGDFNVKEAFVESAVPVLAGVQGVQRLELNAAVRLTDYSESGSVTTWKGGLVWDVTDWLRVRGTRSRDIRAPNLGDLYQANATAVANIVDPVLGAGYQTSRVTSGNPGLTPERADTQALGIVLQPTFAPGLSLSLDYFDIDVADAIITPDATTLINRCFAGEQRLCDNITRSATDQRITEVRVQPVNAQVEKTSGVDVELGYRSTVDWFPALGRNSLVARVLATRVNDRVVDAIGARFDYAGSLADATAVPDWRAFGFIALQTEAIEAQLSVRYIGNGVLRNEWTAADIDDNRVASVTYFDVGFTLRPTVFGPAELFGSVTNIMDRAPPRAPVTQGTSFLNTGTNMLLYDLVGRKYVLGVRARF